VDWLDLEDEYERLHREQRKLSRKQHESNNARNKQDAAWRQFITLLEYKAELYGTHVVQVEARGTTKECARCGVETAKPIWLREHSCPACGFETDRDANAAINVLQRGFSELGLGWPEDTPVETVTATDTTHFESVSASHVMETGSLGVVRKTHSGHAFCVGSVFVSQ
jgi:putative transposase